MKKCFLWALAVLIFSLSACMSITPIKKLALPPVTTIKGNITKIDSGGFTLKDCSGSIYVRAPLPKNLKAKLAVGERIVVYGNLLGGKKKMFDGYVIRTSTGEQIIVSNPTPHLGFILQTSFK